IGLKNIHVTPPLISKKKITIWGNTPLTTTRKLRSGPFRSRESTGGFAGVLLGICVVFVIEVIVLLVRVALIGCTNTDLLWMKKDPREKMR
ncbi:hypothetical protein PRIPAC_70062, partial [Pristionchus pacificus]|uniref:Uncharacterized protein n=1 Tax=Pristionchus pacificus TaxID=54126 RepID=A0A2A6C8M3_PRIPA